MGLFSWLFGRSTRATTCDVIWMTDTARARGTARIISDHLASGQSVLVLAHFPDSLEAFQNHPRRPNWTHTAIPDKLTPAAAEALAAGEPRVLLGLVRQLRPDEFPPEPRSAPDNSLPILVLERHFLREHDDQAVRFAESLGDSAAVEFHISFDDPLLRLFAGEWVRGVLQGIGAQENETIRSGMVTRRIAKAQAKIAAWATVDQDADSAAEWLEENQTE